MNGNTRSRFQFQLLHQRKLSLSLNSDLFSVFPCRICILCVCCLRQAGEIQFEKWKILIACSWEDWGATGKFTVLWKGTENLWTKQINRSILCNKFQGALKQQTVIETIRKAFFIVKPLISFHIQHPPTPEINSLI